MYNSPQAKSLILYLFRAKKTAPKTRPPEIRSERGICLFCRNALCETHLHLTQESKLFVLFAVHLPLSGCPADQLVTRRTRPGRRNGNHLEACVERQMDGGRCVDSSAETPATADAPGMQVNRGAWKLFFTCGEHKKCIPAFIYRASLHSTPQKTG